MKYEYLLPQWGCHHQCLFNFGLTGVVGPRVCSACTHFIHRSTMSQGMSWDITILWLNFDCWVKSWATNSKHIYIYLAVAARGLEGLMKDNLLRRTTVLDRSLGHFKFLASHRLNSHQIRQMMSTTTCEHAPCFFPLKSWCVDKASKKMAACHAKCHAHHMLGFQRYF